jgi:hypothetical protein
MVYALIALYLLGVFMQYELGSRVLYAEGDNYKIRHKVLGSLLWPMSSFYFFIRKIFNA